MDDRLERIGAIARLGHPHRDGVIAGIVFGNAEHEDPLVFHIDYFAELGNGRRIESNTSHGTTTVSMPREGPAAIERRYHGVLANPSVADLESYRVTVADLEDAVRDVCCRLSSRDRAKPRGSLAGFVANEVREVILGVRWSERRERWAVLRAALEEQGLKVSRRALDRLPFEIEIDEELRGVAAPASSPRR